MTIAAHIIAKVEAHARASLNQRRDLNVQATHLYLHTEGLSHGQRIARSATQSYVVPRDTVVVLADLRPHHNWGHPCELQMYDAASGDLYETQASEFPPGPWFAAPHEFRALHTPVPAPDSASPGRARQIPQLTDAISRATGKRYALLFSGLSNNRHLNDLEFLYRSLLDVYHFAPEDIITLNLDGTLNYSGDPQPVSTWPGDDTAYRIKIDGAGTDIALLGALDTLKGKLQRNDLLFIHTNNHGAGQPYDPEASLNCYPYPACCLASDFGAKLGTLPHFAALIVMMEQCHSGGFQDAVLNNSTAVNTSFAAACTFDASSLGGPDFDPFACDWIAGVTGHKPNGDPLSMPVPVPASAHDAFAYANEVKVPYDTPVYADKPTGIGDKLYLTGATEVPYLESLWTTADVGQGSGALSWLTADLNGDGEDEVVQLWNNHGHLGMIVYRWVGGAMKTLWITGDIGQGAGAVSWLVGDVNGDGREEVIQQWNNNGQLGTIVYGWSGGAMKTLWSTGDIGQGSGALTWLVGDVDGDGKDEIIQQWDNRGKRGTIVYGWHGGAMRTAWVTDNIGQGSSAVSWQIGDIDGDGKAEVVQHWNNHGKLGTIVYHWADHAMKTQWITGDIGQGSGAVGWLIADINGDGKDEIIQEWNNHGKLGTIVYGWTGRALKTLWITGDIGQRSGAVSWLVGDVDKDGRAEVIQNWSNHGKLGTIVYQWDGGEMKTLWNTDDIGQGSGALSWLVGDFNKDGQAEIVQTWDNHGHLGMIVYGHQH